ncbi:dihydroorotase [Amycolatopsis sp. FDAARGOS 1241]|uniref:dihydroorotase n=1 Tax=Amycolatopsis sp. FDAARGOS 1241 TaxID=2778070 RepID=UPI00194FEF3E|nr:dihydroorotase [Amycolatopsis sp. FDAARGOS 1241]QRP43289.1 dihydroorotase [Amycolatopsis sp. FDAARGOS 1241]
MTALGNVVLSGVSPLGGDPVDVVVRAGRIAGFRPAGTSPAPEVVDAAGLVLLPAFVDLHTHLREPGGEEAETIATGTAAAAAGGYSDVFAMANCSPVTDSPERVEHVLGLAERTASARVHAVGAITEGLAGQRLAPLAAMAGAGARMFSDDGRCVDDPVLVREALAVAARTGTVIAQHAQCGRLAGSGQINAGPAAERTGLPPWPSTGEETIVARDVVLAADAGAALHVCHVSTARTVALVRWAKAQGWPVTAEVTPHHLLLTDTDAATAQTRYKVNPPLRSAQDVAALREALRDGTIDAVATDHAPHPAAAKAADWCGAPFGMTGLETALAVVVEALGADWALVAERMAHAPARIGGITGVAGRPIAAGEPATFTLVDPRARWTVDPADTAGRSHNTPFEGLTFTHRPVATVVDGHVTADRGGLFPGSTR